MSRFALEQAMIDRGMEAIRMVGVLTTPLQRALLDVSTSKQFAQELLRLLHTPMLAIVAHDIATALEHHGHVPPADERGVFVCAYASLAGVVVRTFPAVGRARLELHSYAQPIDPPSVHALVYRHYGTRELTLNDVSSWCG